MKSTCSGSTAGSQRLFGRWTCLSGLSSVSADLLPPKIDGLVFYETSCRVRRLFCNKVELRMEAGALRGLVSQTPLFKGVALISEHAVEIEIGITTPDRCLQTEAKNETGFFVDVRMLDRLGGV